MTAGIKSLVFPVKDLGAAKRLYGTLLSVEPHALVRDLDPVSCPAVRTSVRRYCSTGDGSW